MLASKCLRFFSFFFLFRSRWYSRFGWNRRRTGHASRSQLERDAPPLASRSRSLNQCCVLYIIHRYIHISYIVYFVFTILYYLVYIRMYLIRTGEGRARFLRPINNKSHPITRSLRQSDRVADYSFTYQFLSFIHTHTHTHTHKHIYIYYLS